MAVSALPSTPTTVREAYFYILGFERSCTALCSSVCPATRQKETGAVVQTLVSGHIRTLESLGSTQGTLLPGLQGPPVEGLVPAVVH